MMMIDRLRPQKTASKDHEKTLLSLVAEEGVTVTQHQSLVDEEEEAEEQNTNARLSWEGEGEKAHTAAEGIR